LLSLFGTLLLGACQLIANTKELASKLGMKKIPFKLYQIKNSLCRFH
jgi:hypothetical protein